MQEQLKRWIFPFSIFFLALFGVFVLPFLLPPPYLAGVSAANVAGFNNKVSALAAAALGIIVLLAFLRSPKELSKKDNDDFGRLPKRFVATAVVVVASIDALLCTVLTVAKVRFLDASYFIDQVSEHVDFGRKLYEQIEFPYGPIIFYGPILAHTLLAPLHVSLTAAYFVTLVAEHLIGLLLAAYVLESLPIARTWKMVFFSLCALNAIPFSYGLNYTLFRALGPVALLVASTKMNTTWKSAGCLAAGQIISFGISPEMGFAFLAGAVAYSGYPLVDRGRARPLLLFSPFVAAAVFFAIAGRGYLLMLRLFAHGIYNLVVQPLPHILLFLFALIWLVPIALARSLRSREPFAPMMLALYVFSLALLPVAFGRADPGHVLFNGITMYMLSLAAISMLGSRGRTAWVTCVSGIMLWTVYLDLQPDLDRLHWAAVEGIAHMGTDAQARTARAMIGRVSPSIARRLEGERDDTYTTAILATLHRVVGKEPVATPEETDWSIEQALKKSGQFTPSFYDFQIAVLDASAEAREIQEFNASKWALIYRKDGPTFTETPDSTADAVGFNLHYREKRSPYVVGLLFAKNLEANWARYADAGDYEIYRHR